MAFDEQRFQAVVMQSLQITEKQFRRDLRLGDIDEWDSVAHLDLVASIEQAFAVRFRAEDIVEITSLEELRTRILASQTS
ncbi:MAG TPA: acyl carrier protein [Steroidobacteraceae bacterium]|nr:acyl carrier protein [Steroidobacteraceae bacterium]